MQRCKRHTFLIPGLGRSPGGGHGNDSSILAWRIHGQRSLVGYSSQGLKESDITERTHTHTQHTHKMSLGFHGAETL